MRAAACAQRGQHALLTQLLPAGVPTGLTADTAAELLRRVRPQAPLQRTLRRLAADLITEVRRLDRRIIAAGDDIATAVTAAGCTLAELHGIGTLLAGKILTRVGVIGRFRSTAFRRVQRHAPIEVSSGDVVRHRLARAGDRQLDYCLHVMAITQIRHDTAGRSYYRQKRAAGKSHKEALRCLKRRLSDVVYRPARRRRRPTGDEPGRTRGGGS